MNNREKTLKRLRGINKNILKTINRLEKCGVTSKELEEAYKNVLVLIINVEKMDSLESLTETELDNYTIESLKENGIEQLYIIELIIKEEVNYIDKLIRYKLNHNIKEMTDIIVSFEIGIDDAVKNLNDTRDYIIKLNNGKTQYKSIQSFLKNNTISDTGLDIEYVNIIQKHILKMGLDFNIVKYIEDRNGFK